MFNIAPTDEIKSSPDPLATSPIVSASTRPGFDALIFAFAACAYLVVLGSIHLIVPDLAPVRLEET
jgi:hypothetical protein